MLYYEPPIIQSYLTLDDGESYRVHVEHGTYNGYYGEQMHYQASERAFPRPVHGVSNPAPANEPAVIAAIAEHENTTYADTGRLSSNDLYIITVDHGRGASYYATGPDLLDFFPRALEYYCDIPGVNTWLEVDTADYLNLDTGKMPGAGMHIMPPGVPGLDANVYVPRAQYDRWARELDEARHERRLPDYDLYPSELRNTREMPLDNERLIIGLLHDTGHIRVALRGEMSTAVSTVYPHISQLTL